MSTKQEEGREKWVHEDNLLNHRLTWLGVTQGLLFAALGLIIQQSDLTLILPKIEGASIAPPLAWKIDLLEKLANGVPLLGLVSSLFILLGTLAATVAMAMIKKKFDLPEYGISLATSVCGWISAVGLPYTFCVAWLLVIDIHWGSVFSIIIGLSILVTWIGVVKSNA